MIERRLTISLCEFNKWLQRIATKTMVSLFEKQRKRDRTVLLLAQLVSLPFCRGFEAGEIIAVG